MTTTGDYRYAKHALSLLLALRDLLADHAHWTKGAAARSASGAVVTAGDPQAVQWCLIGGLLHVTILAGGNRGGAREVNEAYYAAQISLTNQVNETLTRWQDFAHRTHPEVLAKIDAAIEDMRVQALAQDATNK
jgi:hypothetical protein